MLVVVEVAVGAMEGCCRGVRLVVVVRVGLVLLVVVGAVEGPRSISLVCRIWGDWGLGVGGRRSSCIVIYRYTILLLFFSV